MTEKAERGEVQSPPEVGAAAPSQSAGLVERLQADANDLRGMHQCGAPLAWKDTLLVCARNADEAAAEIERLEYRLAACYLLEATRLGRPVDLKPQFYWPWAPEWWNPSPAGGGLVQPADAIRMLQKAGALIAAEIDRLERLQGPAPEQSHK